MARRLRGNLSVSSDRSNLFVSWTPRENPKSIRSPKSECSVTNSMFRSTLSDQTPRGGPHERASDAPVTRSHPRGAAGFTLSPSTGGTKTGKFTVIPDVTTPLRTGKLVSHDLSSPTDDTTVPSVGHVTLLNGGLLVHPAKSFRSFQPTVKKAVESGGGGRWAHRHDPLRGHRNLLKMHLCSHGLDMSAGQTS